MLNILRKTTQSLAKTIGSSSADHDDTVFVVGVDVDDITAWELVNASVSDDDDDVYAVDVDGDGDSFDTTSAESESDGAWESRASDGVISLQLQSQIEVIGSDDVKPSPIEVTGYNECEDEEEEEEEEEEDDDDFDVDDELVPWKLADRFGKQRMKKIGKRFCGVTKHNKHKRLAHFYNNKPGCSYVKNPLGKNALGVQHAYI